MVFIKHHSLEILPKTPGTELENTLGFYVRIPVTGSDRLQAGSRIG